MSDAIEIKPTPVKENSVDLLAQPAAASVVTEATKVHQTSYLAKNTEVVPPKKLRVEMQEWHIEGIHIILFFALTISLFIGMWKRPNQR